MFSPVERVQRTDSCSPASVSMSPPAQTTVHHVKEESMDAQVSEDGDRSANCTPGQCIEEGHDENKGFRRK